MGQSFESGGHGSTFACSGSASSAPGGSLGARTFPGAEPFAESSQAKTDKNSRDRVDEIRRRAAEIESRRAAESLSLQPAEITKCNEDVAEGMDAARSPISEVWAKVCRPGATVSTESANPESWKPRLGPQSFLNGFSNGFPSNPWPLGYPDSDRLLEPVAPVTAPLMPVAVAPSPCPPVVPNMTFAPRFVPASSSGSEHMWDAPLTATTLNHGCWSSARGICMT